MGKVIQANFGAEREWAQTREKTLDGLVTVGALYGDTQNLMKAKADCVYHMLREIVEDVPSVQITTKMPQDMTDAQIEAVTEAIRKAALTGIEVAMTHSVQVVMENIYDIATSKLGR